MSTGKDYLEIASPGEPVRVFPLTKARVQIGRASTNDLRLGGGYVSRRHARLERYPTGSWRVIDVGSANGTFVNGRRVQVASLNEGDVLAIGPHRLTFHTGEKKAEATAATTTTSTEREIVPSGVGAVVVEAPGARPGGMVPSYLVVRAHEAGRRLSLMPDIPSALAALADEFRSLLRPKRIAIGREDGEKCEWPVVVDGDGRPCDGSDLEFILVPRVEALRSSATMTWEDTAIGQRGQKARSMLFPIAVGGRRFGHVYVELGTKRSATAEAVELLSLLARQTALVWENLQLQEARRAADEMNRERDAARQIQVQLFPTERNLDPRLELAAENIPASAVSGDYYDFQLLEPGKVVFILADVMGHGLPAALLMASVQAVFRTGVRAGWDLLAFDRHIHEVVTANGKGETFATGLLGLCDLESHQVHFLSAGHHWPSICAGGDRIECPDLQGTLPWGIFVPREPQLVTVELAPGDWSVVAYTDGAADALVAEGKPYGRERLAAVHRQHHDRPADELCEEILTDILSASDQSIPQEDDITLLVLRSPTARGPASVTPAARRATTP